MSEMLDNTPNLEEEEVNEPDEQISLFENHDHTNETCVYRMYPVQCSTEDQVLKMIQEDLKLDRCFHIEFLLPKIDCIINCFFKKMTPNNITKNLKPGIKDPIENMMEDLSSLSLPKTILNLTDFDLFTKQAFESIKSIMIKASMKDIIKSIQKGLDFEQVSDVIEFNQVHLFFDSKTEVLKDKESISWECFAVSCSFLKQALLCENSQNEFEAIMNLKEPMIDSIRLNNKTQTSLARTLESFNSGLQIWKLVNQFLISNDPNVQAMYANILPSQNLFQVIEIFQNNLSKILQGIVPPGSKRNDELIPKDPEEPIWLESIDLYFEQGVIVLSTSTN